MMAEICGAIVDGESLDGIQVCGAPATRNYCKEHAPYRTAWELAKEENAALKAERETLRAGMEERIALLEAGLIHARHCANKLIQPLRGAAKRGNLNKALAIQMLHEEADAFLTSWKSGGWEPGKAVGNP